MFTRSGWSRATVATAAAVRGAAGEVLPDHLGGVAEMEIPLTQLPAQPVSLLPSGITTGTIAWERSAGSEPDCPIGPAGAAPWAVAHTQATEDRTELPVPRVFRSIGGSLRSNDGQPTALMHVAWVCGIVFFISKSLSGPREAAVQAAMAAPNALMYARPCFAAMGLFFASVMPLADMSELRNGGALDKLVSLNGGGSIGATAARKLGRFHSVVFLVGVVFLGMTCVVYTEYFQLAMKHPDGAVVSVVLLLVGFPVYVMLNLSVTVWLLSFRYSCAIVRDAAAKVMYSTMTVNPLDTEAWEVQVVKPAFELNESFKLLSKGWGTGLTGLCAGLWTVSFSIVFNVLNPDYLNGYDRELGSAPGTFLQTNLIIMTLLTPVPLLICIDVANTSFCFNLLLEAANACAIVHGKQCHLDVVYLEDRLRALNKDQGM